MAPLASVANFPHAWRRNCKAGLRSYNVLMPSPPGKARVRRLEATGILIIAVLILLVTLVRYGGHVAWSAR